MYCSTMAVLAVPMALHSTHPVGLGVLVVIVLIAAGAAVAYFLGREYVRIGRRGPGREQSLRPWVMLGLTILGMIALVGLYWR